MNIYTFNIAALGKRVPRLGWLIAAALVGLPVYLAYFYRVLSLTGVVGCAMPLSP